MKTRFVVVILFLGSLVGLAGTRAWSQYPEYATSQPRGGAGMVHYATPIPSEMASPLAGGPAAAGYGSEFMDAHGNPIIMPASYCPTGPGGCYPGGPGGGAYGDPMAVDFGGYTEDQIGPHYFDVAFDAVFFSPDTLLPPKLPAFTSRGVGASPGVTLFPYLDPSGEDESTTAGWRIALRYDLGPLSVLEAAYTGLYDMGFSQTVRSEDVDPQHQGFQLFSIFSQYGFDPAGFIPEFDQANTHTIGYASDLQSTELSYRRYWVGNNTRVTGTWLLGARYLRMTEDFNFSAVTFNNGGRISFGDENDLVGFQLGGDAWLGLRQGLRIGCESKAGVYNNHYKFNSATTVTSSTPNLQPSTKGDQVAFAAEAGAMAVIDILPSWSLRGGYQVMYLNDLVLVGNNISTTQFASVPVTQPALAAEGHALYHGFNIGMEYVW